MTTTEHESIIKVSLTDVLSGVAEYEGSAVATRVEALIRSGTSLLRAIFDARRTQALPHLLAHQAIFAKRFNSRKV